MMPQVSSDYAMLQEQTSSRSSESVMVDREAITGAAQKAYSSIHEVRGSYSPPWQLPH